MYAIVTLMNKDGTFDTVGMRNRAPVSHLKTEPGVLRWARQFSNGRTFRVDFYTDMHAQRPYKTLTETTLAPQPQEA